MSIEEIKKTFSELVTNRNWYSGTDINRFQANEIKRRFNRDELSIGRVLELLLNCGYEINIKKDIK